MLGPGQTFSASATLQVPGAMEGNYLWQVHVNSRGEIYEGANWTNNVTLALTPSILSVPELTVGGAALTNAFSAAVQTAVFKVNPVPGQDLLLSLAGTPPGSGLELLRGPGTCPGLSTMITRVASSTLRRCRCWCPARARGSGM